MSNHITQRVYDNYKSGDPITDKDLLIALAEFQLAAALLIKFGPAFSLARKEADYMAQRLEEFATARKLIK